MFQIQRTSYAEKPRGGGERAYEHKDLTSHSVLLEHSSKWVMSKMKLQVDWDQITKILVSCHGELGICLIVREESLKGWRQKSSRSDMLEVPHSGGSGGPSTGSRQHAKLQYWCEPEVWIQMSWTRAVVMWVERRAWVFKMLMKYSWQDVICFAGRRGEELWWWLLGLLT